MGSERETDTSPARDIGGDCVPLNSLFGCQIGVSNFIFGGKCGYSWGKCSVARKKPPAGQRQQMLELDDYSGS